ncbi:MAG TPA: DUF4836 family protein, partial [Flavisolibacter sp.]|nr:DUF4836 family protein [Flavisolibacter sp.]
MKRTPLLTAAAFASLFFVSCKNSGSSDLAIPKDAAVVLHVSGSSLKSKLSWDEIKASGWFKEASKEEQDSFTRKLMENPESSGVDLDADMAMFMKKQGNGGYMVFEGKLKDAAAFEAFVKKTASGGQVQKDGDLSYINTSSKNIVSWTSNQFFTVTDMPMFNQMNPYGGGSTQSKSFTADSLRVFAKALLSLSNDNSIGDDDRFSSLLKESGDVHLWVNSEQYSSSLGGGMLSMLKLNALLEGNVSAMTLNFDNGKISLKSTQYYGKEMTKLLDKYKSKNVDQALINRIPSQNVIGAMAANCDPAMIKEILKTTGMDGLANMFLGQLGYSLDELIQATNGQFLVSVSDLQMKKKEVTIPAYFQGDEPSTYSSTEPDMKVLFATSVNSKPSFDKLIGLATEKMSPEELSKINFKTTNEWFAASNYPDAVDKFLAGGDNKVPFADKISGHPFGMYIDIQKIMKVGATQLKDASDSATYDASIAMWQDIVGSGGEYKDGKAVVEFTINLVDKSKNSLKQIAEYGDKMSAIQRKKREEMMK